MKKILIFFIFILCFPVMQLSAFNIEISDNRFSLYADQVHLQDILQNLAETGIKIKIDPDINPKITASFKNRDLTSGVESILRSVNHVLVWESVDSLSVPYNRLKEIHVFRPGSKDQIRSLAPERREIDMNSREGFMFVKNEILIRLKDELNTADFELFLLEIGADIIERNEALNIFRIALPEGSGVLDILEWIRDHPGIMNAEPNYVYRVPPPYNAGLSPYMPELQAKPLTGGAVPVAVIDTGLAHGSGLDEYIIASFNSISPEAPISDSLGHGTQMAMVAAGVVWPEGVSDDSRRSNPIIPIRAFDEDGYITNFDLMKSIDFAVKNGARIMSLSWGTETESNFLEDGMKYAAQKGMIIVASAGNTPTGKSMYPAAYSSVIGVGALSSSGEIWENSNYGDSVTFYAPGIAAFPIGYRGDPGLYAGTSISSAFAANVIAGYLSENPDATIEEILSSITSERSE